MGESKTLACFAFNPVNYYVMGVRPWHVSLLDALEIGLFRNLLGKKAFYSSRVSREGKVFVSQCHFCFQNWN